MRRTVVAIFLLVSGLASAEDAKPIRHHVPFSRMEISESLGVLEEGKASWSFNAGFRQRLRLQLSPNYAKALVRNSPPAMSKEPGVGLGVRVAPVHRLDVGVLLGGGQTSLQAKWQLLGEPQMLSDRGNFSLSVFVGTSLGGSGKQDNHANSAGGLLPVLWGEHRWEDELHHFGASVGYRLHSRTLVYLTYDRGFYQVEGEQRVDSSVVEWTAYAAKLRLEGMHLGARWHPRFLEKNGISQWFGQLEFTRLNIDGSVVSGKENTVQFDIGYGL